MRIAAYILAADPAWTEASVLSYYSIPEQIIVTYDRDGLGFTGVGVPVEECLRRLRAIDCDRKMRFVPGQFSRPDESPMGSEVIQRQTALGHIQGNPDWVLQFDTDEVLPNPAAFMRCLAKVPGDAQSVDWPMRTVYRQVAQDEFLEVCTAKRRQCNEYPGAVACRPGSHFTGIGRRVAGRLWRFGTRRLTWRRFPRWVADQSDTDAFIPRERAILHFSWARDEADIRRKLQTWSHSRDFDGESYLRDFWVPAQDRWRELRNFHPIHPEFWPALRKVKIPARYWNCSKAAGAAAPAAEIAAS